MVLAAAAATALGQETRPAGLLPVHSPLAPVQEALLRGDAGEARAALDALVRTASDATLRAIGDQISLLRAATEPVETRAEAMLAVAAAYSDRPVAEAAAVAALAALLSDDPEVGDLSIPLLGRAAGTDGDVAVRRSSLGAARRNAVVAAFLDVLTARAGANDCDRAAIDHARALLARFPPYVANWIVVPSDVPSVLARPLETEWRLRLHPVALEGGLPNPSRLALPYGRPALDRSFPPQRERIEIPPIPPGAWLAMVSYPTRGSLRVWPILATDVDLVVHSTARSARGLALRPGTAVLDPPLASFVGPYVGTRTRGSDPPHAPNAVLVDVEGRVAAAPITTQKPAPSLPSRVVADLWAAQPIYRPGDRARLRLVVRPVHDGPREAVPVRVVLWPRQPCEVTIEERVGGVLAIERPVPIGATAGPARAQVFDLGQDAAAGSPAEPLLDTIAFSVAPKPDLGVRLLIVGPTSWSPGQPSPRLEVLATQQDGTPPAGLTCSVTVTAGSLRQDATVRLGDDGSAPIEIGLANASAAALVRAEEARVTARIMADGFELAKTTRAIRMTAPREVAEPPPLAVEVLTKRPVAGEPLDVIVRGPAGETVLLTAECRGHLVPYAVALPADGSAVTSIATDAGWWPAIDLACSTRELADPVRRGAAGLHVVRDPLRAEVRVWLARPPTALDVVAPEQCGAGDPVDVAIRIGKTTPRDGTTLSVAVVDDRLVEIAGTGLPDPEANLRPPSPPWPKLLSASSSPLAPVNAFAGILGLADGPPVQGRIAPPAHPTRPAAPQAQASDVGAWNLAAATVHFAPDVPVLGDGTAKVTFVAPPEMRRIRVVATMVDAAGAAAVATAVVAVSPHGPPPPGVRERERLEMVTSARLVLSRPDGTPGSGSLEGTIEPPLLPGAVEESAVVTTYPLAGSLAAALDAHLDGSVDVADHLAARVVRDAALLAAEPAGTPRRAALSSGLESSMAKLRALKTRDGYAWTRGGATDFEVTPLVLHALAAAADAGVDPVALDAVPESRDGFLRAASRSFAEAHGNPQAALEADEMREHEAFRKAVPPEKQAAVVVDTVVGVLAVDPTAALPRAAVADLVRQSQALPRAVLARAALALLRAGDRESAAAVRARLATPPPVGDDPAALALGLQLGARLGEGATETAQAATALAASVARHGVPPVFESAIAFAALTLLPEPPLLPRVVETRGQERIRVAAETPALCVAHRRMTFQEVVPESPEFAPVRRLAGADESAGAPRSVGRAGEPLRFELSVDVPARDCVLMCPIPRGMRVLAAPGAIPATLPSGLESARDAVAWPFRAAPVRVRATATLAVTLEAGTTLWPPCRLVDLGSLATLGWSASERLEADRVEAVANGAGTPILLMDPPSLDRACAAAREAVAEAPDRRMREAALAELSSLPAPCAADAILSVLPAVASILDAPEAFAPVLLALGDRRAELWSPAVLEMLATAAPRSARAALADAARDHPEAKRLVMRWLAPDAALTVHERGLAAMMAIARLRSADPEEARELWDPAALRRLLSAEDAGSRDAWSERIAAAKEIPFERRAELGGGGTETAEAAWDALVADLEGELRGPRASLDLLALVAALTDPETRRRWPVGDRSSSWSQRFDDLRAAAGERALGLVESGALPPDALELPLVTSTPWDQVPRILRVLEREIEAGRGDRAVPLGVRILDRRRGWYAPGDPTGAHLARIAISGPKTWRLPAILALAPYERIRLPIVVIEQLLREDDTESAAIDLLVERDDAAHLLRATLDLPLSRYDARRIIDRLVELEPRPFGRMPTEQVLALVRRLDPERSDALHGEIARRAEEEPVAIAAVLATIRDEPSRDVLVRVLGAIPFTDVPWQEADPGAARLRTKLAAFAGDPAAADAVRAWMEAAVQASQSQGTPESAVNELWPCIAAHATPRDVLSFGVPHPPDLIRARVAAWTEDEIRDLLRSSEAQPESGPSVTRFGSVATVVRLIGAERAAAFTDDLVALWRSYAAADASFEALTLFGQMGRGQAAVLREVLEPTADSAPGTPRFDEQRRLAYVAALGRDPATCEAIAPLLDLPVPEPVTRALARYAFEATGRVRDVAAAAPASRPAPPTPHDWQRALLTRLRHEGLGAVRAPEPPIREAWEKALRERGLLLR
jgi:hypothetical protein